MLPTEGKSAALSDAEKRVISITTEAGDPVVYSGNPAELSGARFEMKKAMLRAGAFKLLVSMNASRLPNGTVCVEDIDMIPIVTNIVVDPHRDEYDFDNPCPSTPARVARLNATRALAGQPAYTGVPGLHVIPDKFLKLATINKYEVETEALAFALTQLSIFTDRIHANELLVQCGYDGRNLGNLFDTIEATARAEDITLVTGRRNAFKEAGLKGEILTFDSFRRFFKEFNILEYKCPAAKRLTDEDLAQLVSTLFIKDPTYRKSWSDHVNQPVIRDALGVVVSGPPQTFSEAKLLAEKILRSSSVMAGIDELSSSTGSVLSAEHLAALKAAHIDAVHLPADEALRVAQALLSSAAATDPRRNLDKDPTATLQASSIDVPKGPDGKFLYWAPPMKQCECGTPDEGRHVRYKWPCAWYRKDPEGGKANNSTPSQGGRGKGSQSGGRGGKGGKGKAKGQLAKFTEEQISAAVAALEAANPTPAPDTAKYEKAESVASMATTTSTSSSTQNARVAEFGNSAELDELLNGSTLRSDLAAFFATVVESDTEVVPDNANVTPSQFELAMRIARDTFDSALGNAPGPELLNRSFDQEPTKTGDLNIDFAIKMISDRPPEATSDRLLVFDTASDVTLADSRAALADEESPDAYHACSETSPHSMLGLSRTVSRDRMSEWSFVQPCNHAIDGIRVDANRPHAVCSMRVDSDADVAPPLPGGSCQSARRRDSSSDIRHVRPPCQEAFMVKSPSPAVDATAAPAVTIGSESIPPAKKSLLPIFRAGVDSCCTATCTASLDMLVNVKECDETFKVADGKTSRCVAIGDMPVLARSEEGKIFRFVLRNVRYVPGFEYTLISVTQIWDEQGVNAQFADSKRLQFPDGTIVPFDPRFRLCAVTLISEPVLLRALESRGRSTKTSPSAQECHVGFHNVKATAHIARLPAAQASELLHRRCHLGINKIRSLPHVTSDAPKILASAVPGTCTHCATAQIRRAGHSGTLETPASEPGELHLDLKGPFPLSAIGKYRYIAFFIDEYSRFVFIVYLHDKSEVIEATKLVMAKFNAMVGTPVDEAGVPLARPRIRRLHRDREGGLESHRFEAFRAHEGLHSTTSPPHDHDLNPIAESTINVIATLATAFKSQAGIPIGFWPEIFRHAVDWHNSVPQASIGSSTAEPHISPFQRFTLKQPKVMDLFTIGSRAVVLKPPQQQSKTNLSSRGWVGMFLGRSSDALGTYEVWVPEIRRKVKSSSVVVDEEHFPWLGANAHQPLVSATHTSRFLNDHIASDNGVDTADTPPELPGPNHINDVPRPKLSFFNLFSGPYDRKDGLSNVMSTFGWDSVTNLDNDKVLGGGWADDLMNDSKYAEILQKASAGAWDAIMAQFPCKTTCIATHFDATVNGGKPGPRPLRNAEFPDGKPRDQLTDAEFKRLQRANRLADRMVEVLIAARRSPRKTAIIVENPSDRDQPGTAPHMSDLVEGHGSWWKMSQYKRLCAAIPDFGTCTFANCRFGADEQKYFTLWYTIEMAPVLDKLNGPDYQCNHEPGSHKAIAGGRGPDGEWRSTATARYKTGMIVKVAMAFTYARTGDPTPLGLRGKGRPATEDEIVNPPVQSNSGKTPAVADLHDDAITVASRRQPGGDETVNDRPAPDGTPRRLQFPNTPANPTVPSAPAPRSRTVPRSRGMDTLGIPPLAMPDLRPSPTPTSPAINLGGGVPSSPKVLPRQGVVERAVRSSTRAATVKSLESQADFESKRRAEREARSRFQSSLPETIPEHEPGGDAPYTTFSGSPSASWGEPAADAGEMEAAVASIVYESAADKAVSDTFNLTEWFDYDGPVPDDAVRHGSKTFTVDVSESELSSLLCRNDLDPKVQSVLASVHSGMVSSQPCTDRAGRPIHSTQPPSRVAYVTSAASSINHGLGSFAKLYRQAALRADSPGAPEDYYEAMRRGPPWPGAIQKEHNNHAANESWDLINYSDVPAGRRLHKFVWVFKEKRDGSAKARLCVQGCTLEAGIDYDQTFAKPLRHASARGLFAYAARNRCRVRSIDLVAAYLQGDFLDGEIVYCKQPAGSNIIGTDGRPMVCAVKKPIYGIPQAGRRLQRKIFPWCVDVMGLRQLDDSDDCVFVYDDPAGTEIFAIGIYVDNLQIVHSAEVDEDGNAIDPSSFYAKFLAKLREDWDILDEGPMVDLLGIDCDRMSDGSILLHQTRYMRKLLSRFAPDGPVHKRCSVPYSADLPRLVIEALEGSTSNDPSHPELIKPYQQRVGALMYACTATRPDLAYAVHQHCRCLSRPTPDLMSELDYVFSYIYENADVGIRFTPEDGVLRGAADASWEVRASTSGWVVYWHGAPLCWGSRKQKSVALSSCESEIMALSEAAKDVVYLRKFTRGLVPSMSSKPTVLSTDNKAARDLSYNPEHHNRSKHIARRHFYVRDMVEAQEIVVPLVNTHDNDADFFTKPLPPKRFKMLRRKVMNLVNDGSDCGHTQRPSFAGGRRNAGG